jgi:hypothetical protein
MGDREVLARVVALRPPDGAVLLTQEGGRYTVTVPPWLADAVEVGKHAVTYFDVHGEQVHWELVQEEEAGSRRLRHYLR